MKKQKQSALAEEVARWESGTFPHEGWKVAPEMIPNQEKSEAISVRIPKQLLQILKLIAAKEGIGYQVLIKRWLDDRVRLERDKIKSASTISEGMNQSHPPTVTINNFYFVNPPAAGTVQATDTPLVFEWETKGAA